MYGRECGFCDLLILFVLAKINKNIQSWKLGEILAIKLATKNLGKLQVKGLRGRAT